MAVVLIINRAVPIAWRSERCVQFGVDDPVLIDGLTRCDAALLDLLRVGLSEDEFFARAHSLGVASQRAQSLLNLLTEVRVLVPRGPRADELTYEADALAYALTRDPLEVRDGLAAHDIVFAGPFRTDLEQLAASAGIRARTVEKVHSQLIPREAIVVLTSVWVPDLFAAGELMVADVEHLTVTFGPDRAALSHFIVPGETPCAGCWAAHQADADADWLSAWKSLRSQTPSPALIDPLLVAAALPKVMIRLRERLLGTAEDQHASVIKIRRTEEYTEPAEFHDRCECLSPHLQAVELAKT